MLCRLTVLFITAYAYGVQILWNGQVKDCITLLCRPLPNRTLEVLARVCSCQQRVGTYMVEIIEFWQVRHTHSASRSRGFVQGSCRERAWLLYTQMNFAMSTADDESSFFDRERDRLSREITSVSLRLQTQVIIAENQNQGFEELLSTTNVLNRKLEEVLGMTKEYDTIASLWHSFYQLMSGPVQENSPTDEQPPGLPGTGGHVVATKQSKDGH